MIEIWLSGSLEVGWRLQLSGWGVSITVEPHVTVIPLVIGYGFQCHAKSLGLLATPVWKAFQDILSTWLAYIHVTKLPPLWYIRFASMAP